MQKDPLPSVKYSSLERLVKNLKANGFQRINGQPWGHMVYENGKYIAFVPKLETCYEIITFLKKEKYQWNS